MTATATASATASTEQEQEQQEQDQEQPQPQPQENRVKPTQRKIYQFILPRTFPFKLRAHLKGFWLSVQELQHWNPLKRHLSAALEIVGVMGTGSHPTGGICCPLQKIMAKLLVAPFNCESGTQNMVQFNSLFFLGGERVQHEHPMHMRPNKIVSHTATSLSCWPASILRRGAAGTKS